MWSKSNRFNSLLCLLLLTALCPTAFSKTIYVDDDATGNNNGLCWQDAYIYLQDALADANDAEKPVEIRVAQGTYNPDRGAGFTSGDEDATFQLINGVTIKGGFAGVGSPDPNARDIELYETILTDSLNSNNTNTSDSSKLEKEWILKARPHDLGPEDDTFRVVTGSRTDDTAVLDGFTITAGEVERNYSERCAGMYIDAGNPTVTNCTFSHNSARRNGGGMFCINNSNPVLINCKFTLNYAICGGGLCNYDSNPKLTNCKFTNNFTTAGPTDTFHIGGGGIYNRRSNPTLTNCIFSGNFAGDGGGMYNYESTPVLINCTFSGNTGYYGAGMANTVSNPVINNCIFSGNFVNYGTGSAIDGGNPTLVNCIVWENTSPQISADASITFSNIQGGWEGKSNIDEDPLFAEPGYWVDINDPNIIAEPNDPNAVWIEGDYHLKSQAGRWDPVSGSWVIDDVTSPCIDAGDPNSPIGDEPLPNGGIINMGAYGGTSEASLSPRLPGKASNPYPTDGATDVSLDVILSWSSGSNALSHDVYFGTDFNDVNEATALSPNGVLVSQSQDSNSYNPGRLKYDQIYYWRIDEADIRNNKTIGDIWMFTTYDPPPPKGCACFTGNTRVRINGATVPISEVLAGQNIGNPENTSKVEKVKEHEGTFTLYDIALESGKTITIAENHYFMAESGRWISLQDLITEQILPCFKTRLKTSKGTIGITSITKRPMPYVGKVYNLKIQGLDMYMVGEDAIIVRDY